MADSEHDERTRADHLWAERVQRALDAVEVRKPATREGSYTEFDVWADPPDLETLEAALGEVGLLPYRPARSRGHRFFLGFGPDGWIKVDAKLRGTEPRRFWDDVLWLLERKRGVVVALLGADGAGKSTTTRCLEESMPVDVTVRYLGGRARPSGGEPGRSGGSNPSRSNPSRKNPSWRSYAGIAKWIPRTLLELWKVEVAARRGTVVLCDRHPIESGRIGPEPRPVQAIKRAVVRTLAPRPDLVILLDAPGAVLFERKGEHSPEHLDRMTASGRRLIEELGGRAIRADRPAETVCAELQQLIWTHLSQRRTS